MEFHLYRWFAVFGSLVLTGLLLELIRRRKLKDELWIPWLIFALTPLVASLWLEPWETLALWLGIIYEPALLLGLGILMSISMILYLTVVISTVMRRNLRLSQELALLGLRVESLATQRGREPSGERGSLV